MPLSNSQNLGKDQALPALPPVAALVQIPDPELMMKVGEMKNGKATSAQATSS